MLAGDFDFTLAAGSALTAAVSGAPVKVIYVHVAKSLYFLYAREGISDLKGLEGKRVGIDAIGGTQDLAVRQDMRLAGADDTKTIFLAMGYQNTPPSMIAGAIDAGVTTPPKEFQLIDRDQQQRGESYTGIPGIPMQDQMIQESMGPIIDRTMEHLGISGRMVMITRRALLDAVKDYKEKGAATGSTQT
jgi:ABC-type nitrate/sulfonate/bicarbonate transport system substrate-binding protein